MSFAGGVAARGAATQVQLPLGQLALVGLGAFCVVNPDKFFSSLAHGVAFMHNPALMTSQGQVQQGPGQPIIIHQTAPVAAGSSSKGVIVKIVGGAVFCWGTYAVLVTVLPEQAKEFLPVNRKVFNQAVTALGNAVLNLKDTLMEQINALSVKQDELSEKQDKTHTEVLEVKENVTDVSQDVKAVQDALDLCQASLSDAERRTSYIARGVQLLTRGVSTILPENEHLLTELARFNLAGEEFRGPSPMEQRRVQEVRDNLGAIRTKQNAEELRAPDTPMRNGIGEIVIRPRSSTPVHSIGSSLDHYPVIKHNKSEDPENDIPNKNVSPLPAVEQSVAGIHTLLRLHSVGEPRRSLV